MASVANLIADKLLEIQGPIAAPPESAFNLDKAKGSSASPFAIDTEPYLPVKTPSGNALTAADADGKIPLRSPERFIQCRVGCLMARPRRMCVRDAYREAYNECIDKGYRLYASDTGYNHSLLSAILSTPARLVAMIGDTLALAAGRCTESNDQCITVGLPCADGGHLVPSSGRFRIGYGEPNNFESMVSGFYNLPPTCAPNEWYQMCVPLQTCPKIRKNCVLRRMPMQNMYLRCCRTDSNTMRISDARLGAYLVPQASLLDPNAFLRRCSSGATACPFEAEPRLVACSSDAGEGLDPNQNLEATKGTVSQLMNELLSSAAHKWRCHGFIGRTNIVNCGNDAPGSMYRIGGATETLTAVAVLRRVRKLHCAEHTAELLTASGAVDVLEGLRACFATIPGAGIPTIHQLLNHRSSLPEASTLTMEKLRRALNTAEGASTELSGTERQALLGQLLREARPLGAPGTMFHHSHLNTMILRHILHCWRADDISELRSTCVDLGMPSADLSIRVAKHAECVESRVPFDEEMSRRPAWNAHMLSHCDGLSARTSELAAFISGATHDCKHTWHDDEGARCSGADYCFVPALASPAVSVHRSSGSSFGWGWYHGSVLRDSPQFGTHGLHVQYRCGETLAGHTTVMCRVPAMRMSFALNTTAPLAALLGAADPCAPDGSCYRPVSILGTLGKFVRALLTPMYAAASLTTERARYWEPNTNAALCAVPPPCENYAAHLRYGCNKYPFFAEPVAELKSLCEAGEMLSIFDGSTTAGKGYGLTIRQLVMQPSEAALAAGDSRRFVRYELLTTTPYGERTVRQIVYDPQGFVYNDEARAALSLGGGRSTRSPCYRVLCPNTGLLSEYIGINKVRFGAEFANDWCVSFGGRAYVRNKLYAVIRRSRWPSEQEVLSDNLMAASEIKNAAPVSTDIAALANTLQSAKPVAAKAVAAEVPEAKGIAWRGGRRGWGGRGWGWAPFAVGATVGALGAAAVAPYYYGPGYGAGYYPGAVRTDVYGRAYVIDGLGRIRYV